MRRRIGKAKKTGVRKINVPNLSGLTRSQAQSALTAVGLAYSESTSNTGDSNLTNIIVSQGVANQTTVLIGSSVSFVYYNYVAPPPPPPPAAPPAAPPADPPAAPPAGPPAAPPADPPAAPPADPPAAPPYDQEFFVYSVGSDTKVLTVSGYKAAQELVIGEELLSLNIQEITTDGQMFDLENWSSESFTNNGIVTTTITGIRSSVSKVQVQINGDWFSDNHYILVKKNGVNEFLMATEIDSSYQIFNYQQQSWVNINSVNKTFVDMTVFSIDCEPYDMFFTEGMLVYNVKENL